MNKEYTYIDGKVIIKDEEGNQKPVEYYDNIDYVLVQENLVETMENRIENLKKESEEYKKYNKKKYFPIIFPLTLIMTISTPLLFYLMGDTSIFASTVDTIFGTMNEAIFFGGFFTAFFLPIGAFLEYSMYSRYKEDIKKQKGINNELEFLKKQIIVEKENLKELIKNKSRENENKQFRVVKVKDLERLKAFKSWIELYYDLGYNDKKYYKYFEQGNLDKKLGKYYNEEGIEAAKDYLEDKGLALVKKKNNKK